MRVPSPDPADAGLPVGASAWFDGLLATDLVEVADDPRVLDDGGWWAVVVTFEGIRRFYRFAQVRAAALPSGPAHWHGSAVGAWRSSLDQGAYQTGVHEIRRRIREGDVYQVNLCRVLRAPIAPDADPWALARRLAVGNPATFAGVIDVPERVGTHTGADHDARWDGDARGGSPSSIGSRLVCASPELYLERDHDLIRSGPIKGTGATAVDLTPKDEAENVMIVDLVRNDLQRVSRPGTVEVTALLEHEQHPGLVHLVSTVQGRLRPATGWSDVLAATFPPGSVSGAPKSSALGAIRDLEPTPRGPYCGAIGYVDADRHRARLAVGIRTFWWHGGDLCFGTGAGITWGSDPQREWAETELKAARLVALASGRQVNSRATAASRSR